MERDRVDTHRSRRCPKEEIPMGGSPSIIVSFVVTVGYLCRTQRGPRMTNSEDVRACPHCARPFLVVAAVLGKTIRCRDCRRSFLIPLSKPMPVSIWRFKPRLPRATQAVVDGKDVRRCPVCGRAFAMQPSLSGKRIRCRGCKNMFIVGATHDASESFVMPRSPAPARQAVSESANMAGQAARRDYSEDIGDELEDGDPVEQCPAAVPSTYLVGRRDNPAGAAASIAAVVLGGLTALPATLLILWWIFGQDPMRIAPHLPEALRWLAPRAIAS